MDALALLCTLHADGPTTLRRLRDAGCTSLDDLGRVRAERIAELLDVKPAAARRFLREARNLAERLGGRALEPEEAMDPSSVPGTPKALPSSAPGEALVPAGRASLTPRDLDRSDRRVLAKVIERWRAEEARGAQPSTPRPPLAVSAPRAAEDAGPPVVSAPTSASIAEERANGASNGAARQDDPVEPREVRVPAPALPPRGTPLAEGLVDGLDADACTRLAGAGCRTLEDLARDDALALAEAADLAFTRLRRLQFLARRATVAPVERLSPSPLAAVSPAWSGLADPHFEGGNSGRDDSEGAAGPFA